jgi:hypothetical protein
VVPEQDPARGGNEVSPVCQPLGGRGAAIVDTEYPDSEKAAVESVRKEVGADSCQDHPGRVDGFTPVQGEHSPGGSSSNSDQQPSQSFYKHG